MSSAIIFENKVYCITFTRYFPIIYIYRKSNLPVSTNRQSTLAVPSSVPRSSNIARASSTGKLAQTRARSTSINRPSSATRPTSATRPSSATRSSNHKRLQHEMNGGDWTFGRQSSIGLRRYGSDSHLNTPTNRFGAFSTPIRRPSAALDSARKTDNNNLRQTRNENIAKVQEYLQRDANFYGDLNLRNDCLKSMTAAQFYAIINHFARLITGKKIDAFIHCSDPLEGILEFMRQLNYPYTVNKSMLKTPNAPHTFDNVMIMLRWLGDACDIPYLASDDTIIDACLLKHDQCLPNAEYTADFSKAVQHGYSLWNNESDDHTALMDGLVDKLISTKLNGKVSTVAELDSLTERLKIKSKELRSNPVRLHNVHQYEQLESKYTDYETKEHDLMNQIEERQDRLAAITVSWNDRLNKMKQSNNQMTKLANQIRNQRYNIDEYKKLSQDMVSLRVATETIRSEIKSVEGEESNQQIIRARLLKKCSEAITAINERAIEIVKLLKSAQLLIDSNIDLNDLHLPPNPTVRQVQTLDCLLSKIFSMVKIEKIKIRMELDQTNLTWKARKAESQMLAKDFDSAQKKYKEKCFELGVNEKKSIMKNKKNENCARKLNEQAAGSKAELDELKQQIDETNSKIKRMEEENVRYMKDGEAVAMEIIQEKKRMVQRLDELEKQLNEAMDEMNFM